MIRKSVVRMGDGGRIERVVRWPKGRDRQENSNMWHDYSTSCDYWFRERFIDPYTMAIRGCFNGLALEYFYSNLICPVFVSHFRSGEMEKILMKNYKKIIPPALGTRILEGGSFDTESEAYNTCMHFCRLFEGDHGNKGEIHFIKAIRVLEESSRDSAPSYAYEDDGLIFPARYPFNVIFPADGNQGIILRLRLGGMVKQRDDGDHHIT